MTYGGALLAERLFSILLSAVNAECLLNEMGRPITLQQTRLAPAKYHKLLVIAEDVRFLRKEAKESEGEAHLSKKQVLPGSAEAV